jgi:hypothetical protein
MKAGTIEWKSVLRVIWEIEHALEKIDPDRDHPGGINDDANSYWPEAAS